MFSVKQQVEQDGIYAKVVASRDCFMVVTARHGNICGPRLAFSLDCPEGPTSGLSKPEADRMCELWDDFLRSQDEKGRDKYDPKRKKQF